MTRPFSQPISTSTFRMGRLLVLAVIVMLSTACTSSSDTPVLSKDQVAYLNAIFGNDANAITLKEARLDGRLLKLKWLVGRDAPSRVGSFVHIYDQSGTLIHESDSDFFDRRTQNKDTTEISDGHLLFSRYKSFVPTSSLKLEVGVYDLDTGKKLAFRSSSSGVMTMTLVWSEEPQTHDATPTQ